MPSSVCCAHYLFVESIARCKDDRGLLVAHLPMVPYSLLTHQADVLLKPVVARVGSTWSWDPAWQRVGLGGRSMGSDDKTAMWAAHGVVTLTVVGL